MPATPSTSRDGQRRSARQRIDLSQAEEGFDRHQLELALRASFNEANKQGLFEDPSTSSGTSQKSPSKKASSTSTIRSTEKRKIGKKEAKRIAARKVKVTPKKKEAPAKKVEISKKPIKIEKEAVAAPVVEEKLKEEKKVKTSPVKKKAVEVKFEKKKPTRTSDFITLLACAKTVLGDR